MIEVPDWIRFWDCVMSSVDLVLVQKTVKVLAARGSVVEWIGW